MKQQSLSPTEVRSLMSRGVMGIQVKAVPPEVKKKRIRDAVWRAKWRKEHPEEARKANREAVARWRARQKKGLNRIPAEVVML